MCYTVSMDIEINKSVLEDALLWAVRFLASNNAEPSMSSVQIKTDGDNNIQISSANIETYTECLKECHITKPGEAIVGGHALLGIIKLMPETAIRLYTSSDDGKFHIEAKKSKHFIPLVRTEIIAQKFDEISEAAVIKSDQFTKFIDQVSIAVAKDDATPILTAVHLELDDNKLTASTIDRYRVAKKVIDIKSIAKEKITANIKFKTLSTIINGIGKVEDITLYSSADNHKFGVSAGDKKAISTLISGEFPDTTSLFKSDYANVLEVESDTFKENINRASVLADASHGIILNISKDLITINYSGDDVGADEVIDCKYSGEDIQFKFNPVYLKEGIAKIDMPTLRLKFSESTQPIEFIGVEKDKEDSDYRYIVVPIRVV